MLSLISQHINTLLKVYLEQFLFTGRHIWLPWKKMECILKGKEKKGSCQNQARQKYWYIYWELETSMINKLWPLMDKVSSVQFNHSATSVFVTP